MAKWPKNAQNQKDKQVAQLLRVLENTQSILSSFVVRSESSKLKLQIFQY